MYNSKQNVIHAEKKASLSFPGGACLSMLEA